MPIEHANPAGASYCHAWFIVVWAMWLNKFQGQMVGGMGLSTTTANPLPPHICPVRLNHNRKKQTLTSCDKYTQAGLAEATVHHTDHTALHDQHEVAASSSATPASALRSYEEETDEHEVPDSSVAAASPSKVKAAGVLFYCLHPSDNSLQILLVWQKSRLTLPGGKRQCWSETSMQIAAREVEEETHRQLTVDRVMGMLTEHDSKWIGSSKYQLYWVHLAGEWDLPDRINACIERGEMHPEALNVKAAMWVDLNTIHKRKAPDGKIVHHIVPGFLKSIKKKLKQITKELQAPATEEAAHDQPASSSAADAADAADDVVDAVTSQLAGGVRIVDTPQGPELVIDNSSADAADVASKRSTWWDRMQSGTASTQADSQSHSRQQGAASDGNDTGVQTDVSVQGQHAEAGEQDAADPATPQRHAAGGSVDSSALQSRPRPPVLWPEGVPLSELPEKPQITVVGLSSKSKTSRH